MDSLREKGMKEVIWQWGWNGPPCLAFRPLWIDIIFLSDIIVGMQQGYNSHSLLLDHSFKHRSNFFGSFVDMRIIYGSSFHKIVADHGNLCRWHTIIFLTLATTSLLNLIPCCETQSLGFWVLNLTRVSLFFRYNISGINYVLLSMVIDV
jgi:hypothetical protein